MSSGGILWSTFSGSPFIQSLNDGQKISILNVTQQGVFVQGDAAIATLDIDFIASEPKDGTILHIMGMDSANYVVIPVSDTDGGFIGNGDIYLKKYETVTIVYNASIKRYTELGRF